MVKILSRGDKQPDAARAAMQGVKPGSDKEREIFATLKANGPSNPADAARAQEQIAGQLAAVAHDAGKVIMRGRESEDLRDAVRTGEQPVVTPAATGPEQNP